MSDVETKSVKRRMPGRVVALIALGLCMAFSMAGCATSVDAQDYYQRGLEAMQRGDHKRAARHFGQVAKLDPPGISRGYERRAEAYLQMGRYRKALKDWGHIIEAWPDHGAAYLGRALTYERMNKPEKAISDYRQVLALPDRGQHALARQRLGELVTATGKDDKGE